MASGGERSPSQSSNKHTSQSPSLPTPGPSAQPLSFAFLKRVDRQTKRVKLTSTSPSGDSPSVFSSVLPASPSKYHSLGGNTSLPSTSTSPSHYPILGQSIPIATLSSAPPANNSSPQPPTPNPSVSTNVPERPNALLVGITLSQPNPPTSGPSSSNGVDGRAPRDVTNDAAVNSGRSFPSIVPSGSITREDLWKHHARPVEYPHLTGEVGLASKLKSTENHSEAPNDRIVERTALGEGSRTAPSQSIAGGDVAMVDGTNKPPSDQVGDGLDSDDVQRMLDGDGLAPPVNGVAQSPSKSPSLDADESSFENEERSFPLRRVPSARSKRPPSPAPLIELDWSWPRNVLLAEGSDEVKTSSLTFDVSETDAELVGHWVKRGAADPPDQKYLRYELNCYNMADITESDAQRGEGVITFPSTKWPENRSGLWARINQQEDDEDAKGLFLPLAPPTLNAESLPLNLPIDISSAIIPGQNTLTIIQMRWKNRVIVLQTRSVPAEPPTLSPTTSATSASAQIPEAEAPVAVPSLEHLVIDDARRVDGSDMDISEDSRVHSRVQSGLQTQTQTQTKSVGTEDVTARLMDEVVSKLPVPPPAAGLPPRPQTQPTVQPRGPRPKGRVSSTNDNMRAQPMTKHQPPQPQTSQPSGLKLTLKKSPNSKTNPKKRPLPESSDDEAPPSRTGFARDKPPPHHV